MCLCGCIQKGANIVTAYHKCMVMAGRNESKMALHSRTFGNAKQHKEHPKEEEMIMAQTWQLLNGSRRKESALLWEIVGISASGSRKKNWFKCEAWQLQNSISAGSHYFCLWPSVVVAKYNIGVNSNIMDAFLHVTLSKDWPQSLLSFCQHRELLEWNYIEFQKSISVSSLQSCKTATLYTWNRFKLVMRQGSSWFL